MDDNAFINNLNISNLYISTISPLHSIEYCFLFLTSESFRQKSTESQQKSITKLRHSLGTQIQNIVNSDKLSKVKALILDFNPKLHESFLNPEHVLDEEFIFVIETVVKSHSFIIAENKSFVIHTSLQPNKEILIIHKQNERFEPIYTDSDTFIFNTSMDNIKLINSFHIDKNNSKNTYNISVTTSDALSDSKTQQYILQKDDIIFDEFDESITIKYNNKNFLQKFTDDEKQLYVQNLLSSVPSDKATGNTFLSLFDSSKPIPNSLYNMSITKVSSVTKHINDYNEYIDNFAQFKTNFPNTPFSKSVYSNDTEQLENKFDLDNENAIRNSFTTQVNSLYNDNETIDIEDCESNKFTVNQLQAIATKYKITIKGSKISLCEQLLHYNFLLPHILEKLSNTSTTNLKNIVLENGINLPKKSYRKENLVGLLLQNKKHRYLQSLFNLEELRNIATTHHITVNEPNSLFETLTNINLLKLYIDNEQPSTDNMQCEIDDYVTAIMAANQSNENKHHFNHHLEYFRPMRQDELTFEGFYYNGDKLSNDFQVFDVDKYLRMLFNIQSTLPVKCELHYFDNTVRHGTVMESLQTDNLLKIKTTENKIVYYNLKNIHDNPFFLYTNRFEGYKYNKTHLDKNIFFIINKHAFQDMLAFVSFNLDQYLRFYQQINLSTMSSIQHTLQKFNRSFDQINFSDYEILKDVINKSKITTNSVNTNQTASIDSRTINKQSVHDFLQSNNQNLSDLHKMFLLHTTPMYFQTIFDIYHKRYLSHSENTLDTNISFHKNTDTLKPLPDSKHTFHSFDEMKEHKQQVTDSVRQNIDIILTVREKETTQYLLNLQSVVNEYAQRVAYFNDFTTKPHEKDFLKEITYTKPHHKELEGSLQESVAFINTNPNVYGATIEQTENDTDINNDALHYFSKSIGVTLTSVERNLINRQTKTIFNPILTHFKKTKQPNSLKTEKELSLWNHYADTIVYSAFLTLIVQFKYTLDFVLPKCKDSFSLHGFPLTNDTDKTFTRYLACVAYTLFNKSNNHFQNEAFIDSQIISVIRLIFQKNPSFKTIFDKLAHTIANGKNKNKVMPTIIHNIKPFFNHQSISSKIKPNINYKISTSYKLHNIDMFNISSLFLNQRHFDIVCPRTKVMRIRPTYKHTPKTRTFELTEYTETQQTVLSDDTKEKLTELLDDFADLFKVSNTPLNFDLFQRMFLLHNTNPNIETYYHLLNFNTFFTHIIYKYEFFNEHIQKFRTYISPLNTTNMSLRIYNFFNAVQLSLQDIFKTENIFTFLNINMNNDTRRMFNLFINELKSFLQQMINNYNAQFVDETALKQKAEVLREEEKQTKLTRFDDLEDDYMFIIMELEKTMGVSIDVNDIINNANDLENEVMDQLAEDDDIPE